MDGKLYGYHGDVELEDDRSPEECERDWEIYGVHDFLTNWGPQFDRSGKSFIFSLPSEGVRILNKHLPDGRGMALDAPVMAIRLAIREFVFWFETQATRLSGPGA